MNVQFSDIYFNILLTLCLKTRAASRTLSSQEQSFSFQFLQIDFDYKIISKILLKQNQEYYHFYFIVKTQKMISDTIVVGPSSTLPFSLITKSLLNCWDFPYKRKGEVPQRLKSRLSFYTLIGFARFQ
jgi:hypothetical protein